MDLKAKPRTSRATRRKDGALMVLEEGADSPEGRRRRGCGRNA
jgi:hypothetical protein